MSKKGNFEFIFHPIDGIYRDVTNQFAGTLADFFLAWNIVIDDRAQFCRIVLDDFVIEYRAYGGRIRVNVSRLNRK